MSAVSLTVGLVLLSLSYASTIPNPPRLGSKCFYTSQCQLLEHVSFCNLTHGVAGTCVCPHSHFRGPGGKTCVPLPTKLDDECLEDVHCEQAVNFSSCESNNTNYMYVQLVLETTHKCECNPGYFRQNNNTRCHKGTALPPQKRLRSPEAPVCVKDKCEDWARGLCVWQPTRLDFVCQCPPRHAHKPNGTECVPIQTYLLTLHVVQEAHIYDFVPLTFTDDFLNVTSEQYQILADRITHDGIANLFEESNLSTRYVSSDVIKMEPPHDNTTSGVVVTAHLRATATYLDAISLNTIFMVFKNGTSGHTKIRIRSSSNRKEYGELGYSYLKLKMPAEQGVKVEDEDECAGDDSNDCSGNALCINTLGSYMCVCLPWFMDKHEETGEEAGRICEEAVTSMTPSVHLENFKVTADVKVTCEAHGIPNPFYQFKKGQVIVDDQSVDNGVLTLKSLTTEDESNYTCIATSGGESVESQFQLDVKSLICQDFIQQNFPTSSDAASCGKKKSDEQEITGSMINEFIKNVTNIMTQLTQQNKALSSQIASLTKTVEDLAKYKKMIEEIHQAQFGYPDM